MIKVFAAITTSGVGNPGVLAGGISEALITTAAGLSVAIPSLIGYRYLRGRIDGLVVQMEKEAIKFLESMTAPISAEIPRVGQDHEAPKSRQRSA
jgi:biopolymer transport protein ExbB